MVQGVVRWRRRMAALLFCLACLSPVGADDGDPAVSRDKPARPLVLGVLPFISPITLLERFAPLRDYLSEQTGRTVLLETAPDYPEFIRRTGERQYDAVITAPHFVALALEQGHYVVEATYTNPLSAVVLVRADSDAYQLRDLAGATVATPPDHAIVTWVGTTLIETGIWDRPAPQFRAYRSHNAAYSAVAAGEVAAAVVTVSLVDAERLAASGLRELDRSPVFPAMGILMANDLSAVTREGFISALVGMDDHAAGRAVLERIAYPGYRRANASDFDSLRPYVQRVRQLLGPQT